MAIPYATGSACAAPATVSGSAAIRGGPRSQGIPHGRARKESFDRNLSALPSTAAAVSHTPAARFFPRLDGGEMWSRWDMQDAPPDVLITNYSMLNIMLMRDIEAPIFGAYPTLARSQPQPHFPSRCRRAAYIPGNARYRSRLHPPRSPRPARSSSGPSAAPDPRIERFDRRG